MIHLMCLLRHCKRLAVTQISQDVELATEYSTSSSLENQLSQVAKLIRVQEVRKAERDFFVRSHGGIGSRVIALALSCGCAATGPAVLRGSAAGTCTRTCCLA